jgi:hypothetical protein
MVEFVGVLRWKTVRVPHGLSGGFEVMSFIAWVTPHNIAEVVDWQRGLRVILLAREYGKRHLENFHTTVLGVANEVVSVYRTFDSISVDHDALEEAEVLLTFANAGR